MESIDTLIEPAFLAPVQGPEHVSKGLAVAIRDGRIVAVLPANEARLRYAPKTHLPLPHHLLIPGLVNTHTHAAMTLMRGLADDLPLMRWLQEAIWPAEARFVSPDFVYHGSLLAAAEMLRGGITTCNDMYFYPEAAARAFVEMGIRAVAGAVVLDFPSPYARDADDYLNKGLSAFETFKGEPLLSVAMAPHAPYSVCDAAFKRVIKASEHLDCPIHLHLLETAHEREESQARFGQTPVARLERLGLWSCKVLAVHGVFLTEPEQERLARAKAAVAHCPSSNMKLACGIAPVAQMQRNGLSICLGTDGGRK
jgi:5-methylthioadenosine/S-adenosylhomocysteine deaminase